MFNSKGCLLEDSALLSTELSRNIGHNLGHSNNLHTDFHDRISHCSSNGVKVISPESYVGGKSQTQWADTFWKYIQKTPTEVNPLNPSSNANFPKYGNVQILPGSSGSERVSRAITVSAGTQLFLPLITQEGDNYWTKDDYAKFPEPSSLWTVEDSLTIAKAVVDTVKPEELFFNLVTRNGEISLINDGEIYRQTSSECGFTATVGKDSIFGYPKGTKVQGAQDGYWVMTAPLSSGSYTFHFGVTNEGGFNYAEMNRSPEGASENAKYVLNNYFPTTGTVSQDITYKVTVVPQNVDISALAR